jgi:NADPH-dependent 2,4-dienoyl-CoA reductase/sulfur reductase-like enzyme
MTDGILIAGAGLAAQRGAETLRRSGFDGPIRVVGAEPHRPYDRPPLSKAVLADPGAEERLSFRPGAWYDDADVELVLGVEAIGLDYRARRLQLSDGGAAAYDQLLVATGSRPRTLPLLDGFANVTTLRTLEDARELRGVLAARGRLAIVGAGFIGQEVASAARKAGVRATVVEAAPAPLHSVLGASVGGWFADLHRAEEVEMILDARLAAIEGDDAVEALVLADGRTVPCDHVVVGVGVQPNVEWLGLGAAGAGGMEADANGRTRLAGVWAAGDCAATFDPAVGRHVPGAHWESAGRQAVAAARGMLGLDVRSAPVASFWSDLYDTRIQYLGDAGTADAVRIDGEPRRRDFRATYTRGGRPVGVLLVGRPHELPDARALLAA